MAQSWHDLLFAHWPVDAAELQLLLPPQLQIDALLVPDSTQLFLRPLSRACPLGYSLGIRCGNRLFVARGNCQDLPKDREDSLHMSSYRLLAFFLGCLFFFPLPPR